MDYQTILDHLEVYKKFLKDNKGKDPKFPNLTFKV